MPKGDKVASISFFKERSSDIKTVKTFCIYRQSRFTKIMPIICLLVIPAGLIIRIVKEMLSGSSKILSLKSALLGKMHALLQDVLTCSPISNDGITRARPNEYLSCRLRHGLFAL